MDAFGRDHVYHAGERSVQDRAGQTTAAVAAMGAIGDSIPPAAATFLAEREMFVVAAVDGDGDVWTTHVTGAPGFISVTGDRTIRVAADVATHDPLARALGDVTAVGTIAIDFATRRRMRLNGTSVRDGDGYTTRADRVFANCPKFIAARSAIAVVAAASSTRTSERLDDAARALVRSAETFFIGSAHAEHGVDASHRGGNPGFVDVVDERTLQWPDYRGNAMFLTLGNIAVSPRAGLLFVDWQNGDTLQVTGRAAIDWDAAHASRVPGAQRLVRFVVERVVATANGSPLRWSDAIASRVNPAVA